MTTTTRSLVIEKEFSQPPEKVWRALTEGPLIKEWLMDNDFKPETGHKFQFRSKPVQGLGRHHSKQGAGGGPDSEALVYLGVDGPRVHRRVDADGYGQGDSDPDGAVRLRFRHDAAYQGAKWGWTSFIGKMEKVVDGL